MLVRSLNPKVLQNIVFDMPNRVEELDERHHHEEEPNAGTRAVLFGFAEKKFWLPSLCGQNGHPRTNLTLGLLCSRVLLC